ncbi:MAG: SusF/SusE family outer membrane protein [Bacteroidales bacterium]|nr:SusF/SusE family outer membrane protein [Bacteroidales bacterium]
MKTNFLRKIFCSLALAATVLTANAADRLLIVGEAVWGGWSIDNSIVMFNSTENPDVFKATVNLNANGTFKFLTTTDWGNLEYRAGDNDVTLAEGVASPLVSTEENSNDKQFKVSETANYDIVCDLTAKTIVVKKAGYQTSPLKHTALWMVGSATPGGWSIGEGTMLVPTVDNPTVFKAIVNLVEGEMKIAVNNQTGFGQTFYLRDTTDETKMVFGGDDNKWNITKAGKYDVTVDVVNMTISITETNSTGISSAESASNVTTALYDLGGNSVSSKNLRPGCYIQKSGSKIKKIIVK